MVQPNNTVDTRPESGIWKLLQSNQKRYIDGTQTKSRSDSVFANMWPASEHVCIHKPLPQLERFMFAQAILCIYMCTDNKNECLCCFWKGELDAEASVCHHSFQPFIFWLEQQVSYLCKCHHTQFSLVCVGIPPHLLANMWGQPHNIQSIPTHKGIDLCQVSCCLRP